MARDGRAGVMERALEACFNGEVDALPGLFTENVSGWSPNMLVSSIDELAEVVKERDASLSDVSLQIDALDVVGNKGYAEYRVNAVFSGPFHVDEETAIEPTGREVLIGAAIVAEFAGDKVSAFRNYFDNAALLEQMLD
ncbi:MAG TPA: ester cyclase [Gaiellaceae bacterium]|nr:ester cyclase [Gaiellaceae bacterium]